MGRAGERESGGRDGGGAGGREGGREGGRRGVAQKETRVTNVKEDLASKGKASAALSPQ